MAPITSSIEINATPEVVREKFLNFKNIPKYHKTFIISLIPQPEGKTGAELKPGDKMKNSLGGINVTPIVEENNPQEFRWRGPWPHQYFNLLTGIHIFRFLPSETIPGACTFVQEEDFAGPLWWVMGFEGPREGTLGKFKGFNSDFKGWVEGRESDFEGRAM